MTLPWTYDDLMKHDFKFPASTLLGAAVTPK